MKSNQEDGLENFKSWRELEAEYQAKMTRTDKFFRWWNRHGNIMFMYVCMAGLFAMSAYSLYYVKVTEHKCEQHKGMMLGGQCIQSDVIHKVNLD